jgi:hypothetical protein
VGVAPEVVTQDSQELLEVFLVAAVLEDLGLVRALPLLLELHMRSLLVLVGHKYLG